MLNLISVDRLAEDLWRLVQIPSPTGRERPAALAFAEMLEAAGVDQIEVDESIPDSPCVIGWLNGSRPGNTMQLAGHIDHIDVAHPPPARKGKIISGRGSFDMKGGLAGILEIIRILKQGGCDFPGRILVTVYGLHEEPVGNSRGILGPLRRGIKGDAAIVLEGPSDAAIVMNNGLARWDIRIRQDAPWCHELNAGPGRDDLQKTLLAVVDALRGLDDTLAKESGHHPVLRRESLFIGQIHYGDFFNRAPNECSLQGTRRWQPRHTFEHVQDEMDRLMRGIPRPSGVWIEHALVFIGHSFVMKPEEPVVQSLVRGYKAITKKDVKIGGMFPVNDTQRLIREGGVPALAWGAEGDPAHGPHTDDEYIELDKLEQAVKIVLLTVLDYLGQGTGSDLNETRR